MNRFLVLLTIFLVEVSGQTADTISLTSVENLQETLVYDWQTGLANKTPYNVQSLSLRGIEQKSHPSGVMGQLRDVPGVYGAEMGQGIVKPFIRGLGFSRVVTIFQGNRLENHQWGADHGLGVNDLGLANAKIIKGPASILYGSGAIGGVLLLEDDERHLYRKQWSGNAGFSLNTVSAGYRPYLSVGRAFDNGFFVGIDAAVEQHADYLDGSGRAIGNSRFSSETFRLHTGYRSKNFQAKLSYTYLNQNLGIIEDDEMEESLATTRFDRQMQLPFQHVQDHLLSYNQSTKLTKKVDWHLHLSHHLNDRREIEDAFDEIDLGLVQNHTFYNNRFRFQASKSFAHTVGWMGSYVDMRNMKDAEEILIPDARTWENGLYYLGSWQANNDWTLEYGARYDNRMVRADATADHIVDYGYILPGAPSDGRINTSFEGWTGSLGATKSIFDNQQIKMNLSSGFRAPDLAELYSNGPHPGTNRFEIGNAQFDREQNYQFDVVYQFEHKSFSAMISPFVNLVDNYIYFAWDGTVRPEGNLQEWVFEQEDAYLYGGEFQLNYELSKSFAISASGSIIRGYFRASNDPLTFIPPDNYNLRLTYDPWEKTSTFVGVRYVDDHNRPGTGEFNTDGYTLLNAGVSHTFSIGKNALNLGVSVFNLLNETYVDHMSILRAFDIPSPGRNVMINARFVF